MVRSGRVGEAGEAASHGVPRDATNDAMTPAARHYAVLSLASMGILVLEVALSRTLSVALLSHYAFVAISLAMFGIGLAGLLVYVQPARFPAADADAQLARCLGRFGLWSALAILGFLHLHVRQELSAAGFATLSAAYLLLAAPFVLGGLCVSLVFTHFAAAIGRLYAADLVGASVGCLVAVAALQVLPAPIVPLGVGVAMTAAALALTVRRRGAPRGAAVARVVATVALLALGLATDVARVRYVKNWTDFYSEYEAWNAFSRVGVIPNPTLRAPQTLPLPKPTEAYADASWPSSKWIDIDGTAWTPMFRYDGDPRSVAFLRDSVVYVAHAVRPAARVLVIGTGGGRDILAAKAFGQPSVLGIELNPLMAHVVQDRFGDWAGRPYTLPGVHVLIGEGRSTLAGLADTFDVVQLSLVDTFAAGAAGGFVFSENYLYTTEAFREYWRHLSARGVLSLTRYFASGYPLEVMRLLRVATAAWQAEGVADPGRHFVVLAQGRLATLLASRTPWSAADVATLDAQSAANGMTLVYDPRVAAGTEPYRALRDAGAFPDSASLTTAPTTDDTPYFFQFIRWPLGHRGDDPMRMIHVGNEALAMMALLLGTVSALALGCFVGPLLLFAQARTPSDRRTLALLAYFVGLGFGFMMIEVAVLQRLVLLLGQPVYSLAVGLFALLLFSGLGSLASERVVPVPRGVAGLGAVIVVAALVYAVALPAVVEDALAAPVALRVVLAVALVAPIAFVLGMAYPVGIRVLCEHDAALVPWAWGLNGAMSVVASVAAVFVGARFGFTWTLVAGAAAYAVAFAALAVPEPAVVPGATLASE